MNLNIKPFGGTILKIVIFAFLVLMFFLSSTFLCYNCLMRNYLQKQVAQSKQLCFVCEITYNGLGEGAGRPPNITNFG